ncbi:MAG: EI24 domain-containing protein [Leptospirillia bacterium]
MSGSGPVSGLASLFRAVGLFRSHPRLLLVLMLAPWTINLILFLGGWSMLTLWMTGQVEGYLASSVDAWWTPLLTGFGYFVAVLISGALAFVGTVVGAVIVAAPFHDRLSAASEKASRGAEATVSAMGWITSLREGAKTALVLLIAELAMLPLHFVPLVGTALFVLGSGMALTLGLMDVPLARRGLSLKQKTRFVRMQLGGVFGLSLGVVAISFLPFLNLLAVPVVIIAATLLVCDADPGRNAPLPPSP